MSIEQWLLFIPAAFALNVFPGPNNILSLSNGARYGFTAAFYAGCGRLPAFAVMIILTAIGLGAVLAASETAFTLLKGIGAAYLIYLGIKMYFARGQAVAFGLAVQPVTSLRVLARRDFLVAASNPKAIAIFTAFFPQFLVQGQPFWVQLLLMGSVFLLLEIVAIALYAIGGLRLRGLAGSAVGLRWINRGSGIALICAGITLLFSRRAAATA